MTDVLKKPQRLLEVDRSFEGFLDLQRRFLREQLLGLRLETDSKEKADYVEPLELDEIDTETHFQDFLRETAPEVVIEPREQILIDTEIVAQEMAAVLAARFSELLDYIGPLKHGDIDFVEWLQSHSSEEAIIADIDSLVNDVDKEVIGETDIEMLLALAHRWAQSFIDELLIRQKRTQASDSKKIIAA
jgi:hypothetical protein